MKRTCIFTGLVVIWNTGVSKSTKWHTCKVCILLNSSLHFYLRMILKLFPATQSAVTRMDTGPLAIAFPSLSWFFPFPVQAHISEASQEMVPHPLVRGSGWLHEARNIRGIWSGPQLNLRLTITQTHSGGSCDSWTFQARENNDYKSCKKERGRKGVS